MYRLRCWWGGFLGLLFTLNLSGPVQARAATIVITNLPAYGSFADLGGIVIGAAPASNAVVAFIYVPGYGWVSKPTCAGQLTTIHADGSWSADITTGGSDQLATRIAALLVSTNYNQPCVLGEAFLPTNVLAQAIASTIVTREYPGPRWLSFSGYDWWLKSSTNQVGPGPNYFSDSTNNAWVDAFDQLHLRITNRSNQWQCAELVSARTFGYGNYRFELASSVNNINVNAILGLFTWSDDPVYADREIDVECSRWGNAGDANNAQFVVQPYNIAGHLVRYDVPATQTNSAHVFIWQTNSVNFQSQRGSYSASPPPGNVITNWTCSLEVPKTGDENVRINFWLMSGLPPGGNQEQEIVIRSFQFVPPGTPSSANIANVRRDQAGSVRFTIQTDMDRRYEVQASTDLSGWQPIATLLASNITAEFADTNSISAATRRFYRVKTLP